MNYSEYISQYKGRKGYLLRVHDNSIYEFAIGHSGLLRGNYLIQEVGNDFVILAKNRDNTHDGNDNQYKRTLILLSKFVLILPKGI